MSIRVLSPEVISRIAAGEVVERPASVVKELLENSLDAGASQITVEARGGGLGLIRVTDNGQGIPSGEVELAFHRYATSKLSTLADLENIATLGFRGEALPAIAAVAQVETFTQTPDEPAGTFLSLKDGAVLEKQSRGRPPGTTITVRHLFQSFPARLKFLKSAATENGHISHIVTQYALAFPGVRFVLYLDGRPALRTSGDDNLRDTALEVYGLEAAQGLREVKAESPPFQIQGLVGLPHLARSSRDSLSLFINRRWVRSPLLARSVEEAYEGLLPQERHPLAILHLSLPPTEIDVNVHPTKSEVRFRRAQALASAVQKAVREAIGAPPRKEISPPEGEAMSLPTSLPLLRVLGQLASSYIIAEGPDGLYLIDQHTAHERVLYERILPQSQIEAQGLLEPQVIEVNPQERKVIQEQGGELLSYGFALEPFGGNSYLLRSAPALLQGEDIIQALKEVLAFLAGEGRVGWREKIATSLACHGAVKAGQTLSFEEMRELVQALEKAQTPQLCPHGRPISLHLSSSRLEREFGRS